MKPAIEVHHVTKEYRLGAMQSLRQLATTASARLLGRAAASPAPFKALDDVNFTIQPGEVVGVIGHNGAGKSTLLKILSQITTPTSGHVRVNGRVAPLIEVGAGFVGDMTGRENVYLNGAILGMSRKEIARKFDEIVDFAEMEQFIDTPVKRYSSGMQVKLAFAVATSIKSEILIVDEVLAVGDLAFQRKCFDRMDELIKKQGRTVLLVSHNIRQVERVSNRVILLNAGRIAAVGDPGDVCNRFLELSDKKIHADIGAKATAKRTTRTASSGEIELLDVRIFNKDGKLSDTLEYNRAATIEVRLNVKEDLYDVAIGLGVHTPDMLFVSNDDSSIGHSSRIDLAKGERRIQFRIPSVPLFPGIYSIRLGIAPNATDRPVLYGENLASFSVSSAARHYTRTMNQGFLSLNGAWSIDEADEIQQNAEPQGLMQSHS